MATLAALKHRIAARMNRYLTGAVTGGSTTVIYDSNNRDRKSVV